MVVVTFIGDVVVVIVVIALLAEADAMKADGSTLLDLVLLLLKGSRRLQNTWRSSKLEWIVKIALGLTRILRWLVMTKQPIEELLRRTLKWGCFGMHWLARSSVAMFEIERHGCGLLIIVRTLRCNGNSNSERC